MDAPLLEENVHMRKPPSLDPSGGGHLPLPKHLENLFLTMHYRKMQRELNGPQKKKSRFHFLALGILLVAIYGLSAYQPGSTAVENGIQITLDYSQIILMSIWMFLAFVITSIFEGTKFIILLYWMFVYWPLMSLVAATLFFFNGTWIIWSLLIAEIFTVLMFVMVYYVYPRLVTSRKLLGKYGAARFWGIKLMDDGCTMQYYGTWGRLGSRYHCRYVGETNTEGLPHGQGIWSDDTYNGEILTGRWEYGQPVAPFSSRQYGGKGNTFSAVQLAYFKANDDPFESNKFYPTNDEPPTCGLASVECSIAGHFMSNLPDASLIGSNQIEGEHGNTIGTCCNDIGSFSNTSSDNSITSLQMVTDSRGVQIGGHNYAPTGLSFTTRVKQIIVDIVRDDNDEEKVAEGEEISADRSDISTSVRGHDFKMVVKNWAKIKTKDALIFIPGFNSWLKHSLQTFGQLMAMTPKMNQHVYPILFAWPGAQVMTYRQASFISASENNRKYFLQMLMSLKAEGITNIHIVTHSLGVQTLMSCFEEIDGSPSEVAQCFGAAPKNGYSATSDLSLGKLVCRSITLLNPDFPANAFREHGFRSLRRVCSLITVVGDKADQALFWSSLINGLVNKFGKSQPSVLDFEDRCKQEVLLQTPLGKNIDLLYVEKGKDSGDIVEFQQKVQPSLASSRLAEDAKIWLDCDVVDTTGLDTNVNDLRHSAFNVNSILLRDIEELVVTGKRAADRTTLLHRKGNMYEFCHAPAFIKF